MKTQNKTYRIAYLVDNEKQMMRVQAQNEEAAAAAATYAINAIHVGASYTKITDIKELPANTETLPHQ